MLYDFFSRTIMPCVCVMSFCGASAISHGDLTGQLNDSLNEAISVMQPCESSIPLGAGTALNGFNDQLDSEPLAFDPGSPLATFASVNPSTRPSLSTLGSLESFEFIRQEPLRNNLWDTFADFVYVIDAFYFLSKFKLSPMVRMHLGIFCGWFMYTY
ncbi:MAG: hypothetical protein LBQ43_04190 [Holosporales bacterium]|jgi:hypothetical protein|nr:hypothetical protein [Holosporales bacterium]